LAVPKDTHILAAPVKDQHKQLRSGQSTQAAAVLQSFSRRGHCRGPAPAKDAVNECPARTQAGKTTAIKYPDSSGAPRY
jgi:hypothetical protein